MFNAQISLQHLTAAYNTPSTLVTFELPGDKHVLLNNVNLGEGVRAEVVKTVPHPGYQRLSYVNDIGLAFLANEVTNPYANIGGPYPQANSKIMAAGYGYINEGQTEQSGLNKVELNVASVEACNAHQDSFQSDIQFCTTDIPLGHATCSGDSGGPLWVDVDRAPRVLGIVSHASGEHQCGGNDSYGYFTYITPFLPWINNEIAKFESEQKNNTTMPISGKD
ncbi:hypothetical protein BGZ67_008748 [Mortierella alpina]|nr:hypothetical protein BGZ67_008748 [Mortierella alpina]